MSNDGPALLPFNNVVIEIDRFIRKSLLGLLGG